MKVLAVYRDDDKVRRAGPGENVRVTLYGIEEKDILSGFVLSSVGMYFFFHCASVSFKGEFIVLFVHFLLVVLLLR